MRDCVDYLAGHLWKTVPGSQTKKSEMVTCLRDGCDEIGYLIYGEDQLHSTDAAAK